MTLGPWVTSLSEFHERANWKYFSRFYWIISNCLLVWFSFWVVLTRWLVACTVPVGNGDLIMLGKAAPQWCAKSSSVTQSATCKFGPQGPSILMQTRALRRLQRRDNRDRHRHDSSGFLLTQPTTRRWRATERMGLLKCGRAAPQYLRFGQCSIQGDAGGPLALDSRTSLEHSTDHARW